MFVALTSNGIEIKIFFCVSYENFKALVLNLNYFMAMYDFIFFNEMRYKR